MEDYGYSYVHEASQVVTTLNSGKKLHRKDTEEDQHFRLFVQSVQQATTRL